MTETPPPQLENQNLDPVSAATARLLIATSIAQFVPFATVVNLLIAKGVFTRGELDAAFEKALKTDAMAPDIAAVINPIWDSLRMKVGDKQ
jgi:hypothetical protein